MKKLTIIRNRCILCAILLLCPLITLFAQDAEPSFEIDIEGLPADDSSGTAESDDFIIIEEPNGDDAAASDDDFIIEEGETEERRENTFVDYWNEHFRLQLGSSNALYVGGTQRYFQFLSLNYETPIFPGAILRFGGELSWAYNAIPVEITERATKSGEQDKKRNETLETNTFKEGTWYNLRDSYLQMDITQFAQLSIGRKTILWGQFDFLSPVDLFLPISFSSSGQSVGKQSARIPTDLIQLNIYPGNSIEFQFYAFPSYITDPSQAEILAEFAGRPTEVMTGEFTTKERTTQREKSAEYDSEGNLIKPAVERETRTSYEPVTRTVVNPSKVPKGLYNNWTWRGNTDEMQYAGRMLLYLNSTILGFTYFSGYTAFSFPDEYEELKTVNADPNSVDAGRKLLYSDGNYLVPRSNGFGLEISFSRGGGWVWKAETAWEIRNAALWNYGYLLQNFSYTSNGGVTLSEEARMQATTDADQNKYILGNAKQEFLDYYTWVLDKNDGKLYIPQHTITSALGVDANLPRWSLNIALINLSMLRFGDAQKGYELSEKAKKAERGSTSGAITPPVIPTINVSYYLNAEQTGSIGLLGGMTNIGLGGSLYYLQDIGDNFFFGLSIEALQYWSNNNLGLEVKPKEAFTIGGRLTVGIQI